MKESFEANLAKAQKNEADAIQAYQELKAAKEEEVASGNAQIEAKPRSRPRRTKSPPQIDRTMRTPQRPWLRIRSTLRC